MREGYSPTLAMVCADTIEKSEYLSSINAFKLAWQDLKENRLDLAVYRIKSDFDKIVDEKQKILFGAFIGSKEFNDRINEQRGKS